MSVQELMNLLTPRAGEADPDSCIQCKTLRKQLKAAGRSKNPQAARAVIEAMVTHKNYGHPEDARPISTDWDLPAGSPRVG